MADGIIVDNGDLTDYPVATDDDGSFQHQYVKLEYGADGTFTKVATGANALPIQDGGNSITVDGTVAATQSGTWTLGANSGVDVGDVTINNASGASAVNIQDGGNSITVDGTVAATQSGTWNVGTVTTLTSVTNAVAVTDNSGSLTVDAPVGTPVFVRLSDGSSAITTLPVSLSSVPSHAVTNAGTFATQVTSIAAGTNNIGDVDVLTVPATTLGHKAYTASIASALTTELDALGNNSNTAASSAIDNTSNLDLYHDLTLTVATQGVARSAGATIEIYMTMALDGTNYDDVSHETAELVAVFSLDAATTARQLTRRDIPVPPGLFKYFARNRTGQSLAANSSLLEYRAHSRRIA